MRLSGQFQTNFFFFFFFLRKGFERKKHLQAKINQQKKIKQTINSKGNIFYARKNFKNFSLTKKKNLFKIVLIISFCYTTNM